ncbi:MAG: aldose epimerase family protein [Oscillospiraceae bacterium]|jgi:aldose 1-epimerase
MNITKDKFGTSGSGIPVYIFTIENKSGAKVSVINYGAAVQEICVPDREGHIRNVCLGYPTLEDYQNGGDFFGAVIGRYANRIEGAGFYLGGRRYTLEANEGRNTLHSGPDGYNRRLFDCEEIEDGVKFSLESRDGDQGFPGRLRLGVTYTLSDDCTFSITYRAESDQDTVVNLTNHTYFNLNGAGSGTILDHEVLINSEEYTEIGEDLIPTGKLIGVSGSCMDFRAWKRVGDGINDPCMQMRYAGGYDHNFSLNEHEPGAVCGGARSNESGIVMTFSTDRPGVQFYSGNNISSTEGNGGRYRKRCGLCFETQMFPDSPNHGEFPSAVLKKGDVLESRTSYHFSTF